MSAPSPALIKIANGLAELASGLALLAAGDVTPMQLIDKDVEYAAPVETETSPAVEPPVETAKLARKPREKKPDPAPVAAAVEAPIATEVTDKDLRTLCRTASATMGVAAVNAVIGKSVSEMNDTERFDAFAALKTALAVKVAA